MCMQCVGAAGTALQAATLFGGPLAYKYYRRTRKALGLPDTSAAAEAARAAGLPEPELETPRPVRSSPRRSAAAYA
jgi:hypothetical protein